MPIQRPSGLRELSRFLELEGELMCPSGKRA